MNKLVNEQARISANHDTKGKQTWDHFVKSHELRRTSTASLWYLLRLFVIPMAFVNCFTHPTARNILAQLITSQAIPFNPHTEPHSPSCRWPRCMRSCHSGLLSSVRNSMSARLRLSVLDVGSRTSWVRTVTRVSFWCSGHSHIVFPFGK